MHNAILAIWQTPTSPHPIFLGQQDLWMPQESKYYVRITNFGQIQFDGRVDPMAMREKE